MLKLVAPLEVRKIQGVAENQAAIAGKVICAGKLVPLTEATNSLWLRESSLIYKISESLNCFHLV